MKQRINYSVLFFSICITIVVRAQDKPLAFPGAEGFGKYTTGGRGGKVYIVTNTNDHGSGSLREAIDKKGPRIIVFAVSGTIALESSIAINEGDITIAGQSAPGDGICIRNYPVSIQADNVIIRYMRFRLGDEMKQEADALNGARGKSNIIIDHCSISWATDECASFYRNRNFTMQWCIISESLNHSVHQKGDHGYGGIWGGMKATFHHNLMASHISHLPRFSGSSTTPNPPDKLVDFRNNVIYNWKGNSTYGGEKGRYNVVANYYKPGPATSNKKNWFIDPTAPYGQFYIAGNYLAGSAVTSADNWQGSGIKTIAPDSLKATNAFAVESIREQSAEDAFKSVLAQAGASHKRDAVDVRIVQEVQNGSSHQGKEKDGIIDSQRDVGGWPALRTATPLQDGDADGIPDSWEAKNGLDKSNAQDGTGYTIHKLYTNVEIYLNSLVE
ncbi:MAG TPA: pectate lyase [Ohtaekwangia sp.]|uniref:pectate lyase family protein n=1 Tax=Ohtaekwangia sp. TaxID=2066019 RepID=UPI002F94A063